MGAGLSGLCCAGRLLESSEGLEVVVLEARERPGGRLLSEEGVDLGPAWTWPQDAALRGLLEWLGQETLPQLVRGTSLYQSPGGMVVPFARDESPAGPSAARLTQGAAAIALGLLARLESPRLRVLLRCAVGSLRVGGEGGSVEVVCRADSGLESTLFDAAVVALPPRLAATTISFEPALPEEKRERMLATSTWMADSGKVALHYSSRFWRELGLNGTVFSETGPLRQIWDNSSRDSFVLCGFLFDQDLDLVQSEQDVIIRVIPQLRAIFGEAASTPIKISLKSWRHDPFTNALAGSLEMAKGVRYGDELVSRRHGPIIFSGTETAREEHGHMNGAVVAGHRAAEEVRRFLNGIDGKESAGYLK